MALQTHIKRSQATSPSAAACKHLICKLAASQQKVHTHLNTILMLHPLTVQLSVEKWGQAILPNVLLLK